MIRTLDWLLSRHFAAIERRLDALEAQGVGFMATVQELTAKLDTLDAAITAERAEVQGILQALAARIAELESQGGATTAELTELASRVDQAITSVGQVSEPAPAA